MPRRWSWLAAPLFIGPVLAAAQPATPPGDARDQLAHIAATDDSLWVAVVTKPQDNWQSRIFFRSAGGRFGGGRSTSRRVAALAALDRDLLVFFDDGGVYRYFPDPMRAPTAEAVLPRSTLPLDAIAERGTRGSPERVYAIIPSAAAAELPPAGQDSVAPASQPFDPGGAPLSLAVFDGRGWRAANPLPGFVQLPTDARARPRLGLADGTLWLFAPGEQPGQILFFSHHAEDSEWTARGALDVPRLTDFWAVSFNDRLTLVTATPDPAGGATIRAYRLLGDTITPDAKPANLEFSAPPEGISFARYTGAVGFNQHLGLLALDADRRAYLRFAYLAGPPAEPMLDIADLLAQPGLSQRGNGALQLLTFVLLLGVLTGLFVLRRGSMVNPVVLPPGCALALNVQRLLAWLIDFIPFTVAAAFTLDIPWLDGLRALSRWGIVPDRQGGMLNQNVLVWWTLSVVGHTTYMLVMELIARRTVGKVFARVHLLSELGTRPTAGQILTRNLTRLIELLPQFWIFVVLVLLSRNRQRLGDIFARTVVIRLTHEQATGTEAERTGPSRDEEAPSPDSGKPGTSDADTEDSSGARDE
jgi:uncharacterized RDD family membrane protein YckC